MSKININIKNNLNKVINEIRNNANMLTTYSINVNNLGQIVDLLNQENSYSIKIFDNIINYINILKQRGYGNINFKNNDVLFEIYIFDNFKNSTVILGSINFTNFINYNVNTNDISVKPLNEMYNDTIANVDYIKKIKNLITELENIITIINYMV
jgi:hypothetical protein